MLPLHHRRRAAAPDAVPLTLTVGCAFGIFASTRRRAAATFLGCICSAHFTRLRGSSSAVRSARSISFGRHGRNDNRKLQGREGDLYLRYGFIGFDAWCETYQSENSILRRMSGQDNRRRTESNSMTDSKSRRAAPQSRAAKAGWFGAARRQWPVRRASKTSRARRV